MGRLPGTSVEVKARLNASFSTRPLRTDRREPAQAARWKRGAICRFNSLAEMRVAKSSFSCSGLRNDFIPGLPFPGWVDQQRVIA